MRKGKEDNITEILKLIAPGTPIRDGLESILRAKTGALLLITDNNEVIKEVVDGGFTINEEYTSSKLYELAKMDGAIVLSGDLKRILYANAQLIPSHEIPTLETGTRHRTAERTAKQTGELVISISQRRSIITVFKGNDRYILEDTDVVLNKANQACRAFLIAYVMASFVSVNAYENPFIYYAWLIFGFGLMKTGYFTSKNTYSYDKN